MKTKDILRNKWHSILVIFLILFIASCNDVGQKEIDYREGLASFDANEYPNKNITDGPYVFYENGETILKWIEDEKVIQESISSSNLGIIEDNFGFKFKLDWLTQRKAPIDYKQEFKDVDRIIAISDIHGQYKLFVKILRENNIIDDDNNWCFGTANLIIVGDIFDRGSQVNEALWLVYKLEQQARESGGQVHYLMGNHEEMIIRKDFRYVNEKYLATADKLDLSYEQLFAKNTLMGQWLRTKPVIIQINDILFVHGGISPEFVEQGFTAEQVNKIFLNDILGKTKDEIQQDSVLKFLRGSNGPIWYRGYFREDELDRGQVDVILKHFDKKHIVVGHTSQESIVSLFRNRIFGIDASIKNGKYGEILIYDKGDFFRGTIKMTPKYSSRNR